jgi:hypothetical protein
LLEPTNPYYELYTYIRDKVVYNDCTYLEQSIFFRFWKLNHKIPLLDLNFEDELEQMLAAYPPRLAVQLESFLTEVKDIVPVPWS